MSEKDNIAGALTSRQQTPTPASSFAENQQAGPSLVLQIIKLPVFTAF